MHFRRFDRAALLKCRNIGHTLGVKVDGRYSVELAKRFFNGGRKYLPNSLFILELDFRLRRMYIHIYVGRVDFEIDEIGYLLPCRNQLLIGIHNCFMEIRMTHVASVHEKVLMRAFLAGCLRLRHKTGNLYHRRIYIHREQLLVQFLTEYGKNTLAQRHDGQIEQLRIIAVQIESDIGMHQSDTLKLGQYIAQLR